MHRTRHTASNTRRLKALIILTVFTWGSMLLWAWLSTQNLEHTTLNHVSYRRVIAIVAYDRFEYFRRVVEGVRSAWGSEAYTVLIHIDGHPPNENAQPLI